jgi:hypothetical protein
MLVARWGRRHRAGCARPPNRSDVSVALLLSAFESAAAPFRPMLFSSRLQRDKEVRNARGEMGPPAQSRVRATD